jgi:pimeloyl-ACP methyl ester carboxylesterase
MGTAPLPRAWAPYPRSGRVVAEGVGLRYLEWPSAGPPLLLLHATGMLAWLWAPVAAQLSRDFHVYAFDFPAHGDSDRPARRYRWEAYAEDARAFIQALELGRPRVMGHSMGGATAAILAGSYPELVERLVLLEPVVMVPELIGQEIVHPGTPLASATRKRRAVWPDRAAVIAHYTGRGAFGRWQSAMIELFAAEGTADRPDGQVELKCPPALEAQMYYERSFLDVWRFLRAITCPTLLVYGTQPRPYPRAAAATVHEAVGGSRLTHVQGAGHFIPMEKPDELVATVRPFLLEQEGA